MKNNSGRRIIAVCGILFFSSYSLLGSEFPPKWEGTYRKGADKESISNCTEIVDYFLPYNPVILEVGGYEGENTAFLAQNHPKGRVIVFEPNPRAFFILEERVKGFSNVTACNSALSLYNGNTKLHLNQGIYHNNPEFESLSSLLEESEHKLPYFIGSTLEVPCVLLDDWCRENQVDHIDFIQLDVEGFELQILRSSPHILQTVNVITAKTNFAKFRVGTTQYAELKRFLEESGFVMLSHWYREGLQGEATFVRKTICDLVF